MATREASIRVTMKSAGFMSGLRGMTARVNAAGVKMGAALSRPMKAGIVAAGGAMKTMFAGIGGHLKTMGTLGGAFAIGKFMSDAVSMQHTYRNIANQVNRVKGNSEDWRSIMSSIEPIANKTGQTTAAMASSFQTVFGATGDIEYTKRAMEAVGTAATATGIEADKLGMAMQLAYRKFGVQSEEAEMAVAAFVEKIGVGGMSADDLNNKFAVMAGEAAGAGMQGVKGMSTLLGVMLELDSTIGEKAAPGLKAMFQYLKDNTTQLKKMEKDAGIKFEPDMTAFDKIRKMLESEKGRVAAQMTFTADSRVVYDTLAQPFKQAYDEAMERGEGVEKATKAGLEAYDRSIGKMSASTMKYNELQDQANERLKEDPTVVFRTALNKMASAFNNKQMMDAITKLAQLLPGIAEGFVKLLDFVMKNPALAAGGVVGAKVGISFAGGALQAAGAQIGAAMMKKVAPMLMANAFAAGTKMGIAAKVAMVAAAAMIGYYIGVKIANAFWQSKEESEKTGRAVALQAHGAARGKDLRKKEEQLTALKAEIAKRKESRESVSGQVGQAYVDLSAGLAALTGADVGYVDTGANVLAEMEAQARNLEASIKKQKASATKAAEATDQEARAMNRAAQAADNFARRMEGVPAGSGPPQPLPVTPGHGA